MQLRHSRDSETDEELLRTLIRRQQIITDLGLMALSGTDLRVVMDEAVAMLQQVLDVEYTKILECLPGGEEVILRAGVGWHEDIKVDQSTVGTDKNSQAGFTLMSKEPVIVTDLRTERRFTGPPLLVEHGVVSGMSCIIWGKGNTPYGVLGIHTTRRRDFTANDVTFLQAVANTLAAAIQRKRDEEWLEESERRKSAILEASRDAIITIDQRGKIVDWNTAAENLFNYQREQVIGKEMSALIVPERLRAAHHRGLNHYLRTGEGPVLGKLIELPAMRSDGSEFLAEVTIVHARKGSTSLFSATMRDITERKQAEEALKRSEEKFRIQADNMQYQKSLLEAQQEASPLGIVVVSPEGKILNYNQLFVDMWNLPPRVFDAASDQMALEAAKEQVTDPESFLNHVDEVYRTRKRDHEKITFRDGRVFERFGSPIRSEAGTYYGYVWFFQDITEQESLTRQKDDFLGIASHELKTPVTSIKAYTQILHRHFNNETDELSARMLEKMNLQVDKLTKLIIDLLDVTKVQQGRLALNLLMFDFNHLVEEVVEEVQRTAQNHRIILEQPQNVRVYADRDRIGQVITNLLTNAVKYSPGADKILVKTKITDKLIFSVKDFGFGLSENDRPKVFDRFYRVGDPKHATYPGLGLGLHISSAIIQQHNGKIWVESTKGEGSTFSFSLPVSTRSSAAY